MNIAHSKKAILTLFATTLSGVVVVFFASTLTFVSAEEDLAEQCTLENIETTCERINPTECRSLLEKCEQFYSEESTRIQQDINKTAAEKKTLQNKISSLNKRIQDLSYQINRSNLVIKDLGLQIEDTTTSIDRTTVHITDTRGHLSSVLRSLYEEDQAGFFEVVLSGSDLSDFFDNVVALEVLHKRNNDLLHNIKQLKVNLEDQKVSLDEEKEGLEQVVRINTAQKKENSRVKQDQEYYLRLTEQEYQQHVKEREATEQAAAAIRAKIYELIGVRKVVTYEEALQVAQYATGQVGIRPALLLGVLSQESSIGKNVGQCYMTDPATGSGVVARNGKKVDRVMKPTRDVQPFLQIIKDLNAEKGLALDPFETLVSCPMSFGYGGAMGPAQFIPSTWGTSGTGYNAAVKRITGQVTDPWDLRDASLAASLYIRDGMNRYGGSEGKAIQAYFCGSATNTYWCKWYEKNVLALAACHQQFLKKGSMTASCQSSVGLR